jgi:hypothetical protein
MIGSMPCTEVLDLLRAGFARVDERFDSIEGRIEEFAQLVGRLERETASLRRDMAGLHDDFVGISARLDRHEARLDRIERRLNLSALENTRSQLSARGEIEAEVTPLCVRIVPCATASSKAPRIAGRAASNSRHKSASGRRMFSGMGSSRRKIDRLARSPHTTISSIPPRTIGFTPSISGGGLTW